MKLPTADRSAALGSSLATLAVVVSSACCVGPLGVVFAWAGLGGTTLLAVENVLGPYRPWVLGATVLALAYAFRATYFHGTSCEVDGDAGSGTAGRSGAGVLHQVILWGATTLFLVLLYFTYVHPNLDRLFGIYL